jgi:putative endonuclease
VLYRNFRAKRGGEIDLVCRDKTDQSLVFVEVKTRRRTDFGNPADAVNRAKQALIIRGALAWLRLLRDEEHKIVYRFDVVEVVMEGKTPRVNVIRNAFQMPEGLRG